VQKNCGDVTKKVQAGGRGGSIDNPAYGKCEDRKKEVQTAQTKIQTLQTALKNKNETLEKIVDAQKEAQKSLRELEGKLADHTEYRAAYEACKASLA
jgi:predicted transcriptional regulator